MNLHGISISLHHSRTMPVVHNDIISKSNKDFNEISKLLLKNAYLETLLTSSDQNNYNS